MFSPASHPSPNLPVDRMTSEHTPHGGNLARAPICAGLFSSSHRFLRRGPHSLRLSRDAQSGSVRGRFVTRQIARTVGDKGGGAKALRAPPPPPCHSFTFGQPAEQFRAHDADRHQTGPGPFVPYRKAGALAPVMRSPARPPVTLKAENLARHWDGSIAGFSSCTVKPNRSAFHETGIFLHGHR